MVPTRPKFPIRVRYRSVLMTSRDQQTRVYITQSVDFDGDGSPDMFIAHEISPEDADAFWSMIAMLADIGIFGLLICGLTVGILDFIEWSSTWSPNVWWGIGAAAYLILPALLWDSVVARYAVWRLLSSCSPLRF